MAVFMVILVWFEATIIEFVSAVVLGGGHYIIFGVSNICMFEVAQLKTKSYMPLMHGFFGTGALIAPFIVREMEIQSFYAFSILYGVLTVLFVYYSFPES